MAKFAFPFFGQGQANYYEWFEMWVWFVDEVAAKQQTAIVKRAPTLCKRDAQWTHDNLLWPSTGDQWIQQHLVETYGTAAAKKKMKKAQAALELDPYDDDALDDTLAMGSEQNQFNAEIEKWLVAVHAVQPILFAARRQDHEAGGTKLGAWHKASLAMYGERVQPVLEQVAKKKLKKDDLRRAPITILKEYVGKAMKPAIAKLADRD